MYFYHEFVCNNKSLCLCMCMYPCLCLLVSLLISISSQTLFHYHCPYLCELVLEVSTLLKIVYVYDRPIMCTPNHSFYLSQYVWPYFYHLHYMYDWPFLWMYFFVYNSSSNLYVFVSNWTLPLSFFVFTFDSMSNS